MTSNGVNGMQANGDSHEEDIVIVSWIIMFTVGHNSSTYLTLNRLEGHLAVFPQGWPLKLMDITQLF